MSDNFKFLLHFVFYIFKPALFSAIIPPGIHIRHACRGSERYPNEHRRLSRGTRSVWKRLPWNVGRTRVGKQGTVFPFIITIFAIIKDRIDKITFREIQIRSSTIIHYFRSPWRHRSVTWMRTLACWSGTRTWRVYPTEARRLMVASFRQIFSLPIYGHDHYLPKTPSRTSAWSVTPSRASYRGRFEFERGRKAWRCVLATKLPRCKDVQKPSI